MTVAYILYKTNKSRRFVDFVDIKINDGRGEFSCPFCNKTHDVKMADLNIFKCAYTNREFAFLNRRTENAE